MLNKSGIEQYFLAEKNAGLLLVIFGVAWIILALVFLFFLKTGFYKGSAYVLMVAGLLQAGVGYSIYRKSDKQRVDNVYAFDMNPNKLMTNELPRMEKAISGIKWFIAFEILLFVAGIIFFLKSKTQHSAVIHSVWAGIGAVLVIQALFLVAFDYQAYKRGKIYLDDLKVFARFKS